MAELVVLCFIVVPLVFVIVTSATIITTMELIQKYYAK